MFDARTNDLLNALIVSGLDPDRGATVSISVQSATTEINWVIVNQNDLSEDFTIVTHVDGFECDSTLPQGRPACFGLNFIEAKDLPEGVSARLVWSTVISDVLECLVMAQQDYVAETAERLGFDVEAFLENENPKLDLTPEEAALSLEHMTTAINARLLTEQRNNLVHDIQTADAGVMSADIKQLLTLLVEGVNEQIEGSL